MPKVVEPVPDVNGVNRIAASTSIKGDISSKNDIRIDGTVEGIVYSEVKVVIGESAVVKGNVLCTNIDVWGRMEGNLYVKDLLSVKSSAVINGDINVRRFQVEMGAGFNGSCRMIDDKEFDNCVEQTVKVRV